LTIFAYRTFQNIMTTPGPVKGSSVKQNPNHGRIVRPWRTNSCPVRALVAFALCGRLDVSAR